MRNILLFSLLIIATTFLSCEDPVITPESGAVQLDFYAVYDDQPLVMLEYYAYTNGDDINFGTSDFYISECQISKEDGSSVELIDIELIDFTNQNKDLTTALIPISHSISDIPAGSYNTITFSIGVNAETNSTKPEDYGIDHPLSLSGHYWAAWNSFIFAKFQGKLVQQDSVDVNWLFHTGKDDVFRTFTYPIDLVIDGNKPTVSLSLDHKALFANQSNEYMDIRSKPTNHDPSDLEPLIQVTENMENAITLAID